MLNIKKILIPLDLQEINLTLFVLRQAALLARHFHSEIILLHVVKPWTYIAGSEAAREILEQAIANEKEKLKNCCGPEFDASVTKSIVVKGEPAREILRVAEDEKVDLIVMPTHGYGGFEKLILGSVTAKVLHRSECPVWTGAHIKEVSDEQAPIRNVLCAVDFSAHSPKTIRWAQNAATAFGAQLTLAHITPGVEIYGPGGYHVLHEMKQELVNAATKQMATIQEKLGTNAKVFIGSGDVAKVITQATEETNADLLVVGSLGGRFGTTAYGIIRTSRVPVLNV